MHREERWSMLFLSVVLLPAVLLPAAQKQDKTTSSEHNTVEGAKIFRHPCAACHGTDGRGHGPASVALKHPVPDLTLISERSGGKFPYQRVKGIIEGNEPGLLAHGPWRSRDANLGTNLPRGRIGPRLGRSKVGRNHQALQKK
jgi:hypothetical protein